MGVSKKNRTTSTEKINKNKNKMVQIVAKQSKTLYSMKNIDGTYDDLATWFTSLIGEKGRTEVTKYELVKFLETKNRVPLGILKKTKAPIGENEDDTQMNDEKCHARVVKGHAQCKNDSS